MTTTKDLPNQPSQDEWLSLSLPEQSYWLLKILNHNHNPNILGAKSRLDQDYQRETMLINAKNFAYDDPEVITTTFLCTDWLIRQGYLMDYPSQQSGIYKFTPSGIDLVDLTLETDKSISTIYSFLQNLDSLEVYEAWIQ